MKSKALHLGLFTAASLSLTAQADQQKPNVLFILADDLGIGGLHCFGNPLVETPNIDKLCSQGMKFVNGWAAYPTCRPSRAAILTGQYGPRTGVYRVCDSYGDEDKARYVIPKNHQVPGTTLNLGKVFKNAGYTTAMYGKWHISNERKEHPAKFFGYDEAYVSHGAHYNAKSLPPVDLPEDTVIETVYTNLASKFIEKAVKDEKPFFIYMPYFLIHAPFEARPDYIKYFHKKLEEAGYDFKDEEKFKKAKDKKHVHRLSVELAMTKMLDDEVGRLLKKLDELGVTDNTIVLFTSDNGSYDTHLTGNYRGRKGDVYDGGMRVPYIFRWPGKISEGTVSDARIIGVDIYPTLATLAGIPLPSADTHPLDGVSLKPLLLGKTKKLPKRNLYCCYPKYSRWHNGHWANSWRNVIFNGQYKLIEYPEYDKYELYDLIKDPREQKDLSSTEMEKKDTLTKILHKWLSDINAPKLIPNPDYKK